MVNPLANWQNRQGREAVKETTIMERLFAAFVGLVLFLSYVRRGASPTRILSDGGFDSMTGALSWCTERWAMLGVNTCILGLVLGKSVN